jgi:hypothetical protein
LTGDPDGHAAFANQTAAFEDGQDAFYRGVPRSKNPHPAGHEHDCWNNGWDLAAEDDDIELNE